MSKETRGVFPLDSLFMSLASFALKSEQSQTFTDPSPAPVTTFVPSGVNVKHKTLSPWLPSGASVCEIVSDVLSRLLRHSLAVRSYDPVAIVELLGVDKESLVIATARTPAVWPLMVWTHVAAYGNGYPTEVIRVDSVGFASAPSSSRRTTRHKRVVPSIPAVANMGSSSKPERDRALSRSDTELEQGQEPDATLLTDPACASIDAAR